METTRKKSSKKESSMEVAKKAILKRGGKLSAIARYWNTIDPNDSVILDMRAVLR
jgi:hypothetical protein